MLILFIPLVTEAEKALRHGDRSVVSIGFFTMCTHNTAGLFRQFAEKRRSVCTHFQQGSFHYPHSDELEVQEEYVRYYCYISQGNKRFTGKKDIEIQW